MTAPSQSRPWIRRLAPLLLLVAALIVYRILGPSLPSDHDVVYELGASSDDLTRLDVAWSDPRKPREAPVLSGTWYFAPGKAPRRLASKVRLHDGEWDVEARLEHPSGPAERVSRRVSLGEGTTIIRLEGARAE